MKIIHSVSFFRSDSSGYESPRSGTSQGIFFKNFIKLLVYAHYAAFRGWELVIHHDDRVTAFDDFKFLDRCHDAGLLRLVYMGKANTLCGSMLWRMRPIWDSDADIVVCRDVDSLPMDRDRKMVEEFAQSGAVVHAILDSESHCGPLMGGMTAFRAKEMRASFPDGLPDLKHIDLDKHGSDQRLLNTTVWPQLYRRTFIHQRREDIQYPEAMATKKVAEQTTDLDKVVRHIGAAYPREAAEAILKGERRYELGSGVRPLEMLDELRWPQQEKASDEAKPWYTTGAIEFLEKIIKPEWYVFEDGGGASTEWYSKRVKFVRVYEPDPLWATMIASRVTNFQFMKVRETLDLVDLFCVDGTNRLCNVELGKQILKPGAYLLLDNSETLPEAFEILKGWERWDFKDSVKPWTTTIWRKPL